MPQPFSRLSAIKIFAYQHGLYPRSEQVVAATRSLDRGRVGQDAVDAAFDQDLKRFVEVQRQAGLDFFSDGLLRWQDIFRPLAQASSPQKGGPLNRWFDTNTFFRAPDLSAIKRVAGEAVTPDGNVPQPRVITLPSPFMFSRAARGLADRNRAMQQIASDLLRPAVEAGVAAGARLIHLEEPWLAYVGIDEAGWKALESSLRTLRNGVAATVILHLYFGDAGPHLARLRQLPIDGIGVDLVETDIDELGTGWDKDLMIGCISGRSSSIEPIDATVELARRVADTARPRNLYLSSNSELEFLPTVVAERKVLRLGEAAKRVKELVAA